HYGRVCPVETPEGETIGLTGSLALYADADEDGFLRTPYRPARSRRRVVRLRADEEDGACIALAAAPLEGEVPVRRGGVVTRVPADGATHAEVSPRQMGGLSAGLIPFLDHDDATRALMGCNMQRQAVPLLLPEPPLVATGLEKQAAQDGGLVVRAKKDG